MRFAGWPAIVLLLVFYVPTVLGIPEPPSADPRPVRVIFDAPLAPLRVGESSAITYLVVDPAGRSLDSSESWVSGPANVAELIPDGPGSFTLRALSAGSFTLHVEADAASGRGEGSVTVDVITGEPSAAARPSGVSGAPLASLLILALAAILTTIVAIVAIGFRAAPLDASNGGKPARRTRSAPLRHHHDSQGRGVAPTFGRRSADRQVEQRPPAQRTPPSTDPSASKIPSLPPPRTSPGHQLRMEGAHRGFFATLFGFQPSGLAGSTIIVHGDYVPAKVESRVEIRDSVVSRACFDGSFGGGIRAAGAPDCVVKKDAGSASTDASSADSCTFCGGGLLTFGRKLSLPGGFEADGLCDECQLLVALMMGRRSR